MKQEVSNLPPVPEIGHPEVYYARLIKHAERTGNEHAKEAAKVGQYITLAMDAHLTWDQKLRYFQHALRRHCNPPPLAVESVWLFYAQLANMVREYAGIEAMRLASREDDAYARRLGMGQLREKIRAEAAIFFENLMGMGDKRPVHFNQGEWDQLKIVRNQWVTEKV